MEKVNIFSPFFYHFKMEEHFIIKDAYLDDIIENYNDAPFLSHDWDVHSTYLYKDTPPNKIDWWTSIQHYKKYVNQFIQDYFRQPLDWRIDDDPWYVAYGKNQKADQHDHIDADFSAVHFLKYNPEIHEPIRFIHPQQAKTKYIDKLRPLVCNNLGTCDKQSYYKELYVPEINEGDLIIFPSDMQHLVWGSQTDELRVSIAFNFKIHEERS